MTEQLRIRIKPELIAAASEVCEELGITPTTAVSMFFAQMVKVRGLPFRPSDYAVLDEYGATVEEAGRAVDEAELELDADRNAGRMQTFNGKLPR